MRMCIVTDADSEYGDHVLEYLCGENMADIEAFATAKHLGHSIVLEDLITTVVPKGFSQKLVEMRQRKRELLAGVDKVDSEINDLIGSDRRVG